MTADRIGRALAIVLLAGVAAPAAAQTSSWQQRIAPPAQQQPAQGADAKSARVKSRPVAPAQAPRGPLGAAPAAPAKAPSLGPSTVAISGDGADAAYDAFDQGKYLTALSLAARRAQEGDAISHTLVARIHAEGLGVPRDPKLAAQWYARGAELGDMEAALGLGALHARGEGVPQDFDRAAALFEAAASKGHPEGAYNLALLFLAGKGKAENPRRGYMLMQYAAEKGVMAAMYDLGTLYATGSGTDANVYEAAKWIGRAASLGYPEAEIEFAIILLKDHEVPEDQRAKLRKRAVELLRSASIKGITVAQNRLARCYLEGLGTRKDVLEAAKWHLVAKAGGHEDPALDKVVAGLSRADRQKAVAAAAQWREETLLE